MKAYKNFNQWILCKLHLPAPRRCQQILRKKRFLNATPIRESSGGDM